jgi:hypothetical protein
MSIREDVELVKLYNSLCVGTFDDLVLILVLVLTENWKVVSGRTLAAVVDGSSLWVVVLRALRLCLR